MADTNLNQVIHNVKEAYLTVSGDTPSSVKYGNIDTKVGELVKPVGEIEITENGEYDVTAYATATVNVAGGGEADGSPLRPFVEEITITTEEIITGE